MELLLAFAVTGAVGTLAFVDLFDAPRSAVRANARMNVSLVPLVARSGSLLHYGMALGGTF